MALTEGYAKIQNVAKGDKSLADSYTAKFTDTTADISGAHALITSAKQYLVLIANKLTDTVSILTTMQSHWFNALTTYVTRLSNMGKNPTEYSSSTVYKKGSVVTYNSATYMCMIDMESAEAWNIAHWKKLTPNSLGINWGTDVTIETTNSVQHIKVNNVEVTYALPSIVLLNSESDALNGMVYLLADAQGGE